jgi:hypothetical protein
MLAWFHIEKQLHKFPPSLPSVSSRDSTAAFKALSLTGRAISKEAMTFYFANNRFKVGGLAPKCQVKFLESLPTIGRLNLTSLDLGGTMYNTHDFSRSLSLVRQCTGLVDLSVSLSIESLYLPTDSGFPILPRPKTELKMDQETKECLMNGVAEYIKPLRYLKRLNIICDTAIYDPGRHWKDTFEVQNVQVTFKVVSDICWPIFFTPFF